MIPDITIINRTFSAYTFFALAGALCAIFFVYFVAKKNKLDELTALNMILVCFIGVVLGGHILYGLTNISIIIKLIKNPYLISSLKSFTDWVIAIFGGSVYYGGLTGAIICAGLFVKNKQIDKMAYIDTAVLAIPLFHFFGRLGCFLSGCCYGIVSNFGVIYRYSNAPGANGVKRFPVQLIEAIINILIFLLLYILYKKEKAKGKLLLIYFLCYPTARFLLEFLRGDKIRGHIGFLSTSQIISALYFVAAAIILIIIKIKSNPKLGIEN